jgi:hypothetical protein
MNAGGDASSPRVLLILYNPSDASELAERVRRDGWIASIYEQRGFRSIRENPPDVILIDLRSMPSYGRWMGVLLRESKSLQTIPLVFLEGDPEKTALVRRTLPDAGVASWQRLGTVLKRAVTQPRRTPAAPVPSEKPLHSKLRVRTGSTVALLHAPRGIQSKLGPLPKGSRFQNHIGDAPVILAFFRNTAGLGKELPSLAAEMQPKRTLWIAWPKKAGKSASDLSMPVIREMCQPFHLVDNKVCALDETWSAMAFSRRRSRQSNFAEVAGPSR